MKLTIWERSKIHLEFVMSYLFLPILMVIFYTLFFVVKRYKMPAVKAIREQFSKVMKGRNGRPMLVCLNHLTWVDSVIFQVAVLPCWRMFLTNSWVPWHVLDPNTLSFLAYVSPICKTIGVERMGDRSKVQAAKERITYLLKRGDVVAIFPEGTRSVTGRINTEEFQYGIGDIVRDVPTAQVLCVYLRGDRQGAKTNLPPSGSVIEVAMKVIEPRSSYEGLRASRDIATQIIKTLSGMEEEYFASHQDRK